MGQGLGKSNIKEIVKKNPKHPDFLNLKKMRFLIDKLNSLFSDKAKIINSDFLELKNQINFNNTIIFGNLPYNVSTQILTKLINLNNTNNKFLKLILMFQKKSQTE